MTNRLFPGMVPADIEKKRANEQRLRAKTSARQDFYKELDSVRIAKRTQKKNRQKFLPNNLINISVAKTWLKTFLFTNLVAFGIGSGAWLGNNKTSNDKKTYLSRVEYRDALKNAYTGSDINQYGRRAAAHTMATMLAAVLATILATLDAKRTKRREMEYTDGIIDAMENFSHSTNMPAALRMNLDPVAKKIIAKMSATDRTYFDKLVLSSTIPNDTTYQFAITVIAAHLAKHPDDMQHVIAAFERESIPNTWFEKYQQKQH